jgi:hypothetical protein
MRRSSVPVQLSALLAVVQARVVVLFFSLQFGLTLKVYFDGFLVEVVEVVVEVVDGAAVEVVEVVEVAVEVLVEAVVEEA